MKARRETLWGLLGFSALLWVGKADAQEATNAIARPSVTDSVWLTDRRLTTGEGYRTSTFDFHPGFALEGGYESNFFLRAGTATEPRTDIFTLRATPSIFFNSRAPTGDGGLVARPTFLLRGGAAVSIAEFFSAGHTNEKISSNPSAGVLANVGVAIAPKDRFGGDLHADVTRSIQPSNLGDVSASFNRTVPRAGANVEWRPGGGLFTWNLGYDFTYTYFEDKLYQPLNSYENDISTKGQWRFRPHTSLVFDTTVGFYTYPNTTTQANGDFVRSRVGLNGLITDFMGFTAMVGWGSTFFEAKNGTPAQDYDSVIGQAELRFYLANPPKDDDRPGLYPSTIAFGYSRDFAQSFIGNFYQSDRGYASLGYFFNRTIFATLTGGASRIAYPESFFDTGQARNRAFSNTMLDASAFFEYRFAHSFGVNATFMYTQMLSNELLPNSPTSVPGNAADFDDLRWQRFEALLGVRYVM